MPRKLEYLSDYSNETPLHGFRYTATESKLPKWFWITLVIGAMGLAVSDMYNLVTYYISEPLTVEVKTEANGNLTIPTPTLCMQIHLAPNRIWNINNWRGEMKWFLRQTNYGHKFDFNTGSIATGSYQNYPDVFQSNSSLLALTYLMLGYVTDGELKVLGQKQEYNTLLAVKLVPTYPSVLSQLQPLYSLYMAHNISIKYLKGLVGAALCQQRFRSFSTFQYITDRPTEYLPLCKPSMISHVSFALICTKITETPNMTFYSSRRTFAITDLKGYSYNDFHFVNYLPNLTEFDTRQQFENVVQSETNIVRYNNWYLDLRGRDIPPIDATNELAVWSSVDFVGFSISVSQEYNFYQSNVHKCSSIESNYNCQWRKRAEFMIRNCGCWPTAATYERPSGIVRSCSESQSHKLNNVTNLNYNDYKCMNATVPDILSNECLPDCNVLAYSFSKVSPTKRIAVKDRVKYLPKQKAPVFGYVEFNFCTSGTRQVFTEVLFKSWGGNFVSDFGGSIGTWLGGSLLAFLHIPLFIVDRFVKWKNKRNQGGQTK